MEGSRDELWYSFAWSGFGWVGISVALWRIPRVSCRLLSVGTPAISRPARLSISLFMIDPWTKSGGVRFSLRKGRSRIKLRKIKLKAEERKKCWSLWKRIVVRGMESG